MTGRVEAAGMRATELADAYTALDRYASNPLPTVFGYTSSALVGDELVAIVAGEQPDVVIIDAMFSAALAVAPQFGRPTGVMLHTFLNQCLDMWRGNFAMQSDSRERAGFSPLPPLDVLWGERELLHVNALAAFDQAPPVPWPNVRHGAPVLDAASAAPGPELPWREDDPRPLVMLSFSTVHEQRSPAMLQRALDVLGARQVRVVATLGGIVDANELSPSTNTLVLNFANHDALLAQADLVVGHGGHGTTMRTIRAGVPMVCIPAKGGDQPPIARLVDEWGIGRALPQDASAAAIGTAVDEILSDPAFRRAVRERAATFTGPDGALLAADALEGIAREPARHAQRAA